MHCFAVQPSSWSKFDPHGCIFATDINHAYAICREQPGMMIWAIPNSGGQPIKWCRPDAYTNFWADGPDTTTPPKHSLKMMKQLVYRKKS